MNKCMSCGEYLVPFLSSEDFPTRRFHKRCWQVVKSNEERAEYREETYKESLLQQERRKRYKLNRAIDGISGMTL